MERSLKLLHLEDDTDDAGLIKEIITDEFSDCEILLVKNKDDYKNELVKNKFDIILSDFALPGFNGLDALDMALRIQPDTPFVFLSGHIGEERAIEAMKKGATDYVLKERMSKIIPTIKRALKEKEEKSKRIAAELKILESEEKYRELVENIHDIIFSIDLTGVIQYMSPAIEGLLGYKPEEIIGKNFDAFITDERLLVVKEHIEQSIGEDKSPIELKLFTKGGDSKWVRVSRAPILSGNKIVGIRGVISDVTEKKTAEDELIKAKEKAEESNRLKSNFLANMSHELRTPMIGILGGAEYLVSELSDPEEVRLAETIMESGRRLLNTLNLILDMSRIEAEKLDLNYEVLDVHVILFEIKKLYEKAVEKKNLFMEMFFEKPEILIRTDERLFREILHNLINNALKFTDVGGITVTCKIGINQKSWDEEVIIKVCDSGIGIPEKHLGQIFQEFVQVSEGLGRNYQGTGLGLSITQKFVEKLNGSITVESVENEGTTFTARFPTSVDTENISPQKVESSI